MRWKAYFYLHGEKRMKNDYGKFSLKSNKTAPQIKEMKGFEDDLINLISNVSFRNVNDSFLDKIDKDLKKVNSSKKFYVFANKSYR